MDLLLEKTGHLELDPEDLVAERVHAHFRSEVQGFGVVFYGVLGLQVVVGVVEGAAEVAGDGFGVGGEFSDYVGAVDVVCVD